MVYFKIIAKRKITITLNKIWNDPRSRFATPITIFEIRFLPNILIYYNYYRFGIYRDTGSLIVPVFMFWRRDYK